MQDPGGGGFDVVPGALRDYAGWWDEDAAALEDVRGMLAGLVCSGGAGPRVAEAFARFQQVWGEELRSMAAWSRVTGDRLRACAGKYGRADANAEEHLAAVRGWPFAAGLWDQPPFSPDDGGGQDR